MCCCLIWLHYSSTPLSRNCGLWESLCFYHTTLTCLMQWLEPLLTCGTIGCCRGFCKSQTGRADSSTLSGGTSILRSFCLVLPFTMMVARSWLRVNGEVHHGGRIAESLAIVELHERVVPCHSLRDCSSKCRLRLMLQLLVPQHKTCILLLELLVEHPEPSGPS